MSEAHENHFKDAPIARPLQQKDASQIERAQGLLGIPLEFPSRHSIETFSDVSTYSTGNENDHRNGPVLCSGSVPEYSSFPDPAQVCIAQTATFWSRNKGLVLVVLAQAFGALMSLLTRLLETEGSHGSRMHPFQVRPAVPKV